MTDANCAGSKNPLRILRSFNSGMYGRTVNLPACIASVPMRLRRIRSRLIEAFEAPAAWRRAVKARISAVVIVIRRRWPKKGVRCFFRRSATTRSERRRFVV